MTRDKFVQWNGVDGNAFIAGGVAGMIAQTTVAPIDRVKILLQAQNEHYRHLGIINCFKKVIRFEGYLAFFRGNGAQIVRIVPNRAIVFGANDTFKEMLAIRGVKRPKAVLLSGSTAGLLATTVTFPLDMVMARLAYHTPGSRKYAGIFDAVNKIFREEGGVRGLYRGFSASLIAVPIAYGIKFFVQDLLVGQYESTEHEYALPKVIVHSACGCTGATVAVTAIHPFDVARRRMQLAKLTTKTDKFASNILVTFYYIYKDNGVVRGLYRGLSLNYLKVVPFWGVAFGVTKFLKDLLGDRR